ncbi:MAG: HEAT repeat domain-containing protein, partial [Thermoguttaceae bacterium]|nr:HEAT repeat domain-containing protein [Thermoguttaceae bacterium]
FGLGRIGPPAEAGVPTLNNSLESTDPVLKVVSAWAVAKIKPDDAAAKDRAVTILAEALTSENPLARTMAFRGLADLRPGPRRVLPILRKQLAGKDKAAVTEALQMLAEMGEPAVPALTEALRNPEGRVLAASILAHIGPPAKAAVPALIEIAKHEKNPAAKREAFMALGSIGGAEAGASVATAALNDPDEKVVIAACYALAQMGPAAKEAAPALKKLVASDDDAV